VTNTATRRSCGALHVTRSRTHIGHGILIQHKHHDCNHSEPGSEDFAQLVGTTYGFRMIEALVDYLSSYSALI